MIGIWLVFLIIPPKRLCLQPLQSHSAPWCANRHLEIRLYKFRAFIAEDKDAELWYSPRFDPSDTRAVVFLLSLEVTLKLGFAQ